MPDRRHKPPRRSRPSDSYRRRERAYRLDAQFILLACAAEGCRAVYVVHPLSAVGRFDLCPDCRLVDAALRSKVPLRR